MKLSVTFHVLDSAGDSVEAGRLRWDGNKITADHDSVLLKNIMAEPVQWPGQQPIDPKTEPERWMRNLWQMYRSPYLKALKAAVE
jgi:hypothetical protein